VPAVEAGAMLRTVQFKCSNCGALYQVVKGEAGPETDDRQITCRACGAPLVGRDGQFVLKYFLLRTSGQMIRSA
jgi:DNA-directed RNA polymerase subunit RPC12/RpoP